MDVENRPTSARRFSTSCAKVHSVLVGPFVGFGGRGFGAGLLGLSFVSGDLALGCSLLLLRLALVLK
ncbi:hypothetical protein SAMN05892883_1607 [Jatrophihabitans sp. GAS493]|nr:hypothetical protein SAMN05892883_1607 [Jatrophihabitans sp. GAS493]